MEELKALTVEELRETRQVHAIVIELRDRIETEFTTMRKRIAALERQVKKLSPVRRK